MNTETATGDCFVVAFHLAVDHGWTLCHGTVVRAADGVHHAHAWCERADTIPYPSFEPGVPAMTVSIVTAIDQANGHDIELPAGAYRNLGDAHDVAEWTPEQARDHAHRTGHFGPWHHD